MLVRTQKEYELYPEDLFFEFAVADAEKLAGMINMLSKMENQFREKCNYMYATNADYYMINDCERDLSMVEELKDILINVPRHQIKDALRQLELKYDYDIAFLISDYDGDFIKELLENTNGTYFYIYYPDYDVFAIYEMENRGA